MAAGYAASDMYLLCCIALNGFHSFVSYEWTTVDEEMQGKTPLLYTSNIGNFTCHVKEEETVLAEVKLQTKGLSVIVSIK